MFLLYLPLGGMFGALTPLMSQVWKCFFPQLNMEGFIEEPNEENLIRCIKVMGNPSVTEAKGLRRLDEEEKIRGQLIAALSSYSTFLFMANAFASNTNDKAKIQANLRVVQYLTSKMMDPQEWSKLAEAIWGPE